MSAAQPVDRYPVNAGDAKLLAAVVDNLRCAFERHQDKPKALRDRIAAILSEDGVGQASANVVNAHDFDCELIARTLPAGSTVKLSGLPFVLASDAVVLSHSGNLQVLEAQ